MFQPHEEVAPGGALGLIAEGAFPRDAAAVLGLHASAEHEAGRIGIKPGRDYAGVMDFEVTVTGKGAHAATPHLSIDPIVCACSIITNLQTVISRRDAPHEPSVLTVGAINAGTKNNIIPDTARFCGTIRAFSDRQLSRISRDLREVAKGIARAFGAQAAITFERSYPSGYNDEALSMRAIKAIGDLLGKRAVEQRSDPVLLADDFAYFQKQAPGLYLHLGVAHPEKKRRPSAGIHSSRFLPDERSLETGITALTGLAIDILT
jgi:amidohydrolase